MAYVELQLWLVSCFNWCDTVLLLGGRGCAGTGNQNKEAGWPCWADVICFSDKFSQGDCIDGARSSGWTQNVSALHSNLRPRGTGLSHGLWNERVPSSVPPSTLCVTLDYSALRFHLLTCKMEIQHRAS